MYAAPTAGRMLRDFGAVVTKVEDPPPATTRGTGHRRRTACRWALPGSMRASGRVGHRPARSERRDLVRRLAATVDVVVESFRPGRLEKWVWATTCSPTKSRADPDQGLRIRPDRARTGKGPGFGTVAETASGFAFINGWPDTPPTSPPFGFADSIAGISAAMGTAMALYQRERTGAGEVIDVALYEPLMFIVGDMILKYAARGRYRAGSATAPGRLTARHLPGRRRCLAVDRRVQRSHRQAAVPGDGPAGAIDDPRFATNPARMANNDAIQHEVRAWVATRPRAEVLKILDEFEVVSRCGERRARTSWPTRISVSARWWSSPAARCWGRC